jgi:hypothetical protein
MEPCNLCTVAHECAKSASSTTVSALGLRSACILLVCLNGSQAWTRSLPSSKVSSIGLFDRPAHASVGVFGNVIGIGEYGGGGGGVTSPGCGGDGCASQGPCCWHSPPKTVVHLCLSKYVASLSSSALASGSSGIATGQSTRGSAQLSLYSALGWGIGIRLTLHGSYKRASPGSSSRRLWVPGDGLAMGTIVGMTDGARVQSIEDMTAGAPSGKSSKGKLHL